MKKNKLVIAVATTALMNSMGSLAANKDDFIITYTKTDNIAINAFDQSINLDEDGALDAAGDMFGKIDFCVGIAGAETTPTGYRITTSSTHSGQLVNGNNAIDSSLWYMKDHGVAFNSANAKEVKPAGGAAIVVDGENVGISAATCSNGTVADANAAMWVKVSKAAMEGAAPGAYTDTVTMTVLPM